MCGVWGLGFRVGYSWVIFAILTQSMRNYVTARSVLDAIHGEAGRSHKP